MRLITTALLLGLSLNCAFAQNEEDWYEVELLVFKYLDAPAIASEYWPTAPGEPDWLGTRFLTQGAYATAGGLPKAYVLLPDNVLQLNDARGRIDRKPAYRPLLHRAWRQVVPPRNTPDRIYLTTDSDGDNNTPKARAISSSNQDMDIQISGYGPGDDWASESAIPELEGIFTVGRGRYLHVNLDLVWTPREQDLIPEMTATAQPAATVPAFDDFSFSPLPMQSAPGPRQFRIQANRRMRSGEIHYLDHPMISVLLLFTPYTLPEPEVEEASELEVLPVTTPIGSTP